MTELLEVQRTALNTALGKSGFAYYMEMGLGKTLTVLTEFMHLVSIGKVSRMVVVCPNSFKQGWQEEIKKHGIDVESFIFESGEDSMHQWFLRRNFDKPPVLIINYEAIRKPQAQATILKFVGQRDAMIVFDESIQLKTYNSQQTKAALSIAPAFKVRRILSGKPITQGPHDLWAQMRAIGALNGKPYFPFKTTFCKMGGFKGKKVVGTQNEEILAPQIDPYIFRATKAQWTDLPPKMYTTRQYRLTPELLNLYKSMEEEFVVWLSGSEYVAASAFVTKYIKLAQIQSGFIIDEHGKVNSLVEPDQNPRFLLLREIVEEVVGKIIIPYHHRHTLSILQGVFADYGSAYIRGNMSDAEIGAQKRAFNEDPKCRLIFLQIQAGRYGHTLLGGPEPEHRCSTMIFAENSYSLDDRSQIEDRMHRHGQTADSCLYVDLWGTKLDKEVTMALQRKESIFQAVFKHIGRPNSILANPRNVPQGPVQDRHDPS